MRKLQSVDFTLVNTTLNEQIHEVHTSRMSKEDKKKALVELGLKNEDFRILYGGYYNNTFVRPLRIVTPKGYVFTFGVEMECFVGREDIHRTTEANGVKIAYESYNHTDGKKHYKFVHDGSVRSNDRAVDDNAIECVSPILKGKSGMTSLRKACKSLVEAGATVNKTCGLHVHVGAQDLTQTQIVNVFKNYQKLETLVDSFMPVSRRGNNAFYCQSIKDIDLTWCSDINSIASAFNRSRYFKVNPMSYGRHSTIEFRHHSGTVNPDKVSKWATFCVKLVEWSKENTFASEVTSIDEIPFLDKREKKFFNERIIKLCRNA